MIRAKNESDPAEMAAIQRQLGQKEQELLVLQRAQSDLLVEMESHREAAALHEARTAELQNLKAELASSNKKLLAAEATVDESARELQAHADQLQMMRRKEAQLSREVSKSEAQVHAMYCLNKLMSHQHALEIFSRLDTTGDGRLDASELRSGLCEMGEVLNEMELEELMSFVDEDGDGTVAYEELAKVGQMASELQKKGDEVAAELQRQQEEHSAAVAVLEQEHQARVQAQAVAETAQTAAMEQEMERLCTKVALAKQQVAAAQAQAVEATASEREATTKLAESLESQESIRELLEVAEEEAEVATARLEDTIRQLQCKEEQLAGVHKAHLDVQALAAAQADELQKLRSEACNRLEQNDQIQVSSRDGFIEQAWLDELEKSRLEQSAVAVDVTTPAVAAAAADRATSDTCDAAQIWAAEWVEDFIRKAVGL